MYALMPRPQAAIYMNVADRFLTCQHRDENAKTCGSTWRWATQECILTHWLAESQGRHRLHGFQSLCEQANDFLVLKPPDELGLTFQQRKQMISCIWTRNAYRDATPFAQAQVQSRCNGVWRGTGGSRDSV